MKEGKSKSQLEQLKESDRQKTLEINILVRENRFLSEQVGKWRRVAADLIEAAHGPVFSDQMAVFKHRFNELNEELK